MTFYADKSEKRLCHGRQLTRGKVTNPVGRLSVASLECAKRGGERAEGLGTKELQWGLEANGVLAMKFSKS